MVAENAFRRQESKRVAREAAKESGSLAALDVLRRIGLASLGAAAELQEEECGTFQEDDLIDEMEMQEEEDKLEDEDLQHEYLTDDELAEEEALVASKLLGAAEGSVEQEDVANGARFFDRVAKRRAQRQSGRAAGRRHAAADDELAKEEAITAIELELELGAADGSKVEREDVNNNGARLGQVDARSVRVAKRRAQRRSGRAAGRLAGARAARDAIAAKYGADSEQARKSQAPTAAETLADAEAAAAAAAASSSATAATLQGSLGAAVPPHVSPSALVAIAAKVGDEEGYASGLAAANAALETRYTAADVRRGTSSSAALGSAAFEKMKNAKKAITNEDHQALDGGDASTAAIAACAAAAVVVAVVVVAAVLRRRRTRSDSTRHSFDQHVDERVHLNIDAASSSSTGVRMYGATV